MPKDRMCAFSDGVIAILITIMVLEIHPPEGTRLADLSGEKGILLAYLLSFVNLGIYWNNHHHMLQATDRVNGIVLWANLHLLFWLSLLPISTEWMGRHPSAATPVACYSVVLMACGGAYYLLQLAIVAEQRPATTLADALGRDWKGKGSVLAYAGAIPLAFISTWLSFAIIIAVALTWLIPDRRLESRLSERA